MPDLLLHLCCGPCATAVIERLAPDHDLTLYWFNPNIQPAGEYLRRKDENKRFADKLGVVFHDADHGRGAWLEAVAGHESDPERGARCSLCFAFRLRAAAAWAAGRGLGRFATSLGISRWKDLAQVNAAGRAAALPGVEFWAANWRKGGGSARMDELSRQEAFYRQNYCGCEFAMPPRA